MSCPPTPGKGKVQHCGKEIREPDEQVLPGFTVLPAEAPPYPTLRRAYWSAELPKMDCRALDEPLQQFEKMLRGKEAEVRRLCEEYNLYADLSVRVFAASNDLPELVLPDTCSRRLASIGRHAKRMFSFSAAISAAGAPAAVSRSTPSSGFFFTQSAYCSIHASMYFASPVV